ncbi:MAG: hypothetical protein ABR998_11845 [Gemmatimonadales bacterium]
MVRMTISGGVASFEIEGLDKLWSLKSRLEIPLAHIRGVRMDPEIARGWWHGIKAPGTNVPGVLTAGTFYQHGKRVFWDVHDPERTVIIELADERYDELIIEVADPINTVGVLRESFRHRTA